MRIRRELLPRGPPDAWEHRECSDDERLASKWERNRAFEEYREGVELEV